METKEIIELIRDSEKKTPVKIYIKESEPIEYPDCKVFLMGSTTEETNKLVLGDWRVLEPILRENGDKIIDFAVETECHNSAIPLFDKKTVTARIEPGAIIRDRVDIGNHAIIMMGAIINIGAIVGEGSMIDMGAVLGARVEVGKHCHVGAGAVLAGVIEPPSASPVVLGDEVVIGANAVVLEGCKIGNGAVVGAGAVVTCDVPANAVVVGVPAKVIKKRDAVDRNKTTIVDCLRKL